MQRVVTSLGDSKLTGAFGRVQEGFDVADTRAMGFRDTLTGIQDTQRGFAALTTSTGDATKRVADAQADYNAAVAKYGKDSARAVEAHSRLAMAQEDLGRQQAPLIDKMFLLGTGVGDLASGMANFIVPMVAMGVGLKGLAVGSKVAAAGQWLLNTAMLANPIGLVVVAIVALVAVLVVAYKRSETFRRIIDGAFRGVTRAAQATWRWIRGNWPLLLAVITGPIGLAVRFVVRNADRIGAAFRRIPAVIRGAFSGAGSLLAGAGRRIIDGFIGSVQRGFERVRRKFAELTNMIPDWKGPASRDKELLRGPADLIMDGFTNQLESRFGGVRSMLSSATGSLAPAAASGAARGGGLGGAGGGTVQLVADGSSNSVGALLVAILEEESRKRGGLKLSVRTA